MTYREALEWMMNQLPMYQQKGLSAFKGKMDTIEALARYLDNPHKRFKSIHVAGTNGKGSSSHMLASILQEAGYKTGLYTSPHLKDFRERIRIDGNKVEEAFVAGFIAEHKDKLEELQASFFEMTVAMAFSYFAQEDVDIAIIEVGLGGRLDSTNIITPEVSLITNIGFDHVAVLGNTLGSIAREKGGIIKPGVPVVVSETHEDTASIFRELAEAQGSAIIFADQVEWPEYQTDLSGEYQRLNINGVLATVHALQGFTVPETAVVNGLKKVVKNTGMQGRWQVLAESPKIICDTAHNREGLNWITRQLKKERFKKLHIVMGVVREKELDPLLEMLPGDATYYFCKADVPRGLDAEMLEGAALKFSLFGKSYPGVEEAVHAAKAAAGPDDLIFIGGSTFTVAEAL